MRRGLLILLTVLFAVTSIVSCYGGVSMHSASSFDYFDTVTELVGYTQSGARFNEVKEKLWTLLLEHHRYFDIYNTYDDTVNLASINATVGQSDRSFAVSREIYELLTQGKSVYEMTGGKVNIAIGSVLSLWHECRENADAPSLPDPKALSEAAEHTDINGYFLTEKDGEYRLTVTDPYLRFDVGALAKGYTAKKAVELIDSLRAEDEGYLLNLGGMVCPSGSKKNGEAWVAGVEYPTKKQTSGYLCRVGLSSGALVTSAAHLRDFTVDGKSYSHIIDSDTLYPPEYFASVTVYATDPALGDALSTALFCMTEAEGRALLKDLGGAEAMWVYHDMTSSHTDGFPMNAERELNA